MKKNDTAGIDIFFDVDRTLITEQYVLNMPLEEVQRCFKTAKQRGITIHLNSNRSIEDLLEWYQKFGCNGTIISENGIVAYDPQTGEQEQCGLARIDKERLTAMLAEEGAVHTIDTDVLVKQPQEFAAPTEKTVFFLEASRRYTMTIYPRITTPRGAYWTEGLIEHTRRKLQEQYPQFDISSDNTYGNILMIPAGAEKGKLLKSVSRSNSVCSFGDGLADISMFRESVLFGCPNNAEDAVKVWVQQHNGVVTKGAYTRGAYEFIMKLLEEDNG